ncbi:MAG: hypothetical protein OER86_13915 [Phycisphaerae bacterium]|nr:hypothetical protein [Phycisphaerae bacterium]
MDESGELNLLIRAIYDAEEEAVGIDSVASDAFEAGNHPQAGLQMLAAMAAKANSLAADVIGRFEADDAQKKQLFEEFAYLKEQMLEQMLEDTDETPT